MKRIFSTLICVAMLFSVIGVSASENVPYIRHAGDETVYFADMSAPDDETTAAFPEGFERKAGGYSSSQMEPKMVDGEAVLSAVGLAANTGWPGHMWGDIDIENLIKTNKIKISFDVMVGSATSPIVIEVNTGDSATGFGYEIQPAAFLGDGALTEDSGNLIAESKDAFTINEWYDIEIIIDRTKIPEASMTEANVAQFSTVNYKKAGESDWTKIPHQTGASWAHLKNWRPITGGTNVGSKDLYLGVRTKGVKVMEETITESTDETTGETIQTKEMVENTYYQKYLFDNLEVKNVYEKKYYPATGFVSGFDFEDGETWGGTSANVTDVDGNKYLKAVGKNVSNDIVTLGKETSTGRTGLVIDTNNFSLTFDAIKISGTPEFVVECWGANAESVTSDRSTIEIRSAYLAEDVWYTFKVNVVGDVGTIMRRERDNDEADWEKLAWPQGIYKEHHGISGGVANRVTFYNWHGTDEDELGIDNFVFSNNGIATVTNYEETSTSATATVYVQDGATMADNGKVTLVLALYKDNVFAGVDFKEFAETDAGFATETLTATAEDGFDSARLFIWGAFEDCTPRLKMLEL